MSKYDHKKIEKKWKKNWEKNGIYKTKENPDKQKFYVLDMFPYPSGAGLHVGHPKGYIATDVVARMKMMQGYNVLHPMGWDAFGLPAENYALKNKVHPAEATEKNVETFKKQLGLLGFTYDWDREVNTTDPNYYRWTQWAFIQMFKRGLAFESYEPINWCPECKTGLANEDLENGLCERCGSVVEQKPMRQWVLKITDYAERLLADLDTLKDWPDSIREMQRNWIGKSEGALVKFNIKDSEEKLEVFTTRPDTLFGATYVVLAPEHKLIENLKSKIVNYQEVEEYIEKAKHKTTLERTDLAKEKTGVEIKGVEVLNPVNNEELPIYVADYVLGGYGTGAIMAVPAHDERDFEFAKKYNLPIKRVVAPHFVDPANPPRVGIPESRRKNIHVIIRHPDDGKVLLLDWHTNLTASRPYLHTLIIGGIEEGEDLSMAAIREAKEETGYKNLKFLREVDLEVHTEYYTEHKGQNRYAEIHIVELGLENEERDEIPADELKNHNPIWLDEKDLPEMLNVVDGALIWNTYKNGYTAFTAEGVAINSDFLNGLKTPAAKEKIIFWLEQNGVGKRKTQYKLRDWVFSRQRYWGEPIPLVHCEKCAGKKYRYVLLHGRHGSSRNDFFPWLKNELEQKGYEVYCPDLPNTEDPKVEEQADFIIKNFKLDENTIIVGHSLGGPVALNILEKTNQKIRRLVMVDSLIRPEFTDKRRPDLEKNFHWKFDYKKIKNLGVETITLVDKNYPIITPDQFPEQERELGANLVFVNPNTSHFNSTVEEAVLMHVQISGWSALPESELPLELPKVKHYEPSGTGESPLANIEKWVSTTCPVCGGPAKRETNTMPQWAGSCWYYLRYIDPDNNKFLVDKEKEKYWDPIDLYVGGAEHATRHLIYARFWHKFLYDIGVVSYPEPFTRLQNVGLILAEDGRKMSKRWGNVINPDDVVDENGADAMRLYEMFMGPFDQPCAWNTNGVIGCRRFLEKIWYLQEKVAEDVTTPTKLEILINQTIKKVSEDIPAMRFNTAIAKMMELVNELNKEERIDKKYYLLLLKILSPFAPHLTEEIWNELGNEKSIFESGWPQYDPNLVRNSEINLVVQVNGKVRDNIVVPADISEDDAKKIALDSEIIKKWLAGEAPKKVIFVRGKLVSIVV